MMSSCHEDFPPPKRSTIDGWQIALIRFVFIREKHCLDLLRNTVRPLEYSIKVFFKLVSVILRQCLYFAGEI